MNDVAVVGAGPAGSSLALRLVRAGYDVTIIERATFPRIKVCGDYLCPGAIDVLEELGISEQVLDGAQRIRSITMHGFGKQLRLELPGRGAVSLSRDELDTRLLATAQAAGAKVVRGVFLDVAVERNLVFVFYRDPRGVQKTLSCRVLVGADGARSTVAQRAGLAGKPGGRGRWAMGGKLLQQKPSHELVMHIANGGYYARNPLGPNTANSMLVLPQPVTHEDAETIVEHLSGGELRFERAKMQRVVAIGPLQYRAASVARDRIVLTGDAAEFVDPFTGQGVATALALSHPAFRAASAFLHGMPHGRVVARYVREWQSIVAPRRRLGAIVNAMIHGGLLRNRILHVLQRNEHALDRLVASVCGIAPPEAALKPLALAQVFVA